MALTSRDLFGYAGSHTPDDAVLEDEFEYGALTSPSLTLEEEYASVLADEEAYGEDQGDEEDEFGGGWWYGADDEDEDFGEDDEDFGEDDEDFGEDDEDFGEDDEDEFGGGWWYGADDEDDDTDEDFGEDDEDDEDVGYIDDEYGAEDEIDAMFDELDAELDQDIYGAYYGSEADPLVMRVGSEGAIAALAKAVGPGAVLPEWLQSHNAEGGWIEWFVENMDGLMFPGDAEEIAAAMMDDPAFADWNRLSSKKQQDLVYRAVKYAAAPGLEMEWDNDLYSAYKAGEGTIGSMLGAAEKIPGAIWEFMTGDIPSIWEGWLTEIPAMGKAIGAMKNQYTKRLGRNPEPDEIFNALAIRYWVFGLVFPELYSWIATKVTEQGQEAIDFERQAKGMPVGGAVYEEESRTVEIPLPVVPAPPQPMPVQQSGLPAPQTILAIGYGLMAGGAVLGVFK